MIEDTELLRRYAEGKSEAVFAELVRRHLNFVYAGALRRVGGDTHLAEDVTQQVFIALARAAAPLARRPVLAGWLYTTTRFASAQVVRTERRRLFREQEAHTMNELSTDSSPAADWERLRPVLDDTMDELDDRDREAVLLRFFEGRSFADVGAKLRLTENAARMRVERALDKMHGLLARRGVTSTTAALALALASQAGVAAPAGLGATVTGAALMGAATGAGASVGVAMGLRLFGFMSTVKITIGVIGVAAIVAIGLGVRQANAISEARSALTTSSRQQEELQTQLRDVEGRLAAETQRVQVAERENARLLQVARQTQAADVTEKVEAEPITNAMIDARIKRARELVSNGDVEAALRELLWFYRDGQSGSFAFAMTRALAVPELLLKLGERYPPALTALRARRESVRQLVFASASDSDASVEFAAINHTLREDQATVAVFDQLPRDDLRRRSLASGANDYLVTAQRYSEALEGRPYSSISSTFEQMIAERPLPADTPNPDEVRRKARGDVISSTAASIEMLAGAGDLAHARALAMRLLAYDGAESTRATIQQHAERAGQPTLLASPPSR